MEGYITIVFFSLITALIIFIKFLPYRNSREGKFLLACILFFIISFISDLIFGFVDGKKTEVAKTINYIVSGIYLIAIVFASFFWLCFISFYKNTTKASLKKSCILAISFLIPVSIYSIFVITSYFNGYIFTIEQNDLGQYYYVSNSIGLVLNFIISGAYLLIGAFYSGYIFQKTTNQYNSKQYINMLVFSILPLLGAVFQFILKKSFDIFIPIFDLSFSIALLIFYAKYIENKLAYDELTGLPNRIIMKKVIDDLLKKKTMDNYYMILCDFDRLKRVNDQYGHINGDQAIVDCASIINKICNKHKCLLTRYGGDEFIIITNPLNEDNVNNVINEITYACIEFNESSIRPYSVEVSCGYSLINKEDIDYKDIVERADSMLYRKKGEKH